MSSATTVTSAAGTASSTKTAMDMSGTAACGADRFILLCKFLLRIGKSKLGRNRIQYFPGGCFGGVRCAHCHKIVEQCCKD